MSNPPSQRDTTGDRKAVPPHRLKCAADCGKEIIVPAHFVQSLCDECYIGGWRLINERTTNA
jgi:hypothetical protein